MCKEVGIVGDLTECDGVAVPEWLLPWRALYFSLVTMTTLGFGDMYAHPNSFFGHFFLSWGLFCHFFLGRCGGCFFGRGFGCFFRIISATGNQYQGQDQY